MFQNSAEYVAPNGAKVSSVGVTTNMSHLTALGMASAFAKKRGQYAAPDVCKSLKMNGHPSKSNQIQPLETIENRTSWKHG
jgi:hypothetical protein